MIIKYGTFIGMAERRRILYVKLHLSKTQNFNYKYFDLKKKLERNSFPRYAVYAFARKSFTPSRMIELKKN